MNEDDVEDAQSIADDDCDFAGDVAGCVFWAEGLGADYVAGAWRVLVDVW